MSKSPTKKGTGIVLGLCLGVAIESGIGLAMDNMAFIGVGMAIGAIFGIIFESSNEKKQEKE
jgi:hypothetical protein